MTDPFQPTGSDNIQSSIFFCLITALLPLLLLACGNPAGATPPATASPPNPSVTSPPATVGRPPTPKLALLALSPTRAYTHTSRRFTVEYPEPWEFFEQPDGVIFLDPGNQAGYSVFFNDVGKTYSDEALNQYLVSFVAQNFVDEGSGFAAISQEQLPGGMVVAQFKALDPLLGEAINEIRVLQVETIVFISLISASQEQWDRSAPGLQALADSLVPLDTGPIAAPSPQAEAPVWELIGPAGNTFGFLSPSDWEVLYQDADTVVVGIPESNIRFEARATPWTSSNPAPEAAEEAALAYLDQLSEQYEDIQNLPPTAFPLDTVTGATIDFLYTAEDDTPMAGSVITAANEDQIYHVVFSAPAERYEGALQWFNPMYQSFRFLAPDEFLDGEQ